VQYRYRTYYPPCSLTGVYVANIKETHIWTKGSDFPLMALSSSLSHDFPIALLSCFERVVSFYAVGYVTAVFWQNMTDKQILRGVG
jgi:hypothetical protein